MTKHLTDDQLQSLASGEKLNDEFNTHYLKCDYCKSRIHEYKFLIRYLKRSPRVNLSPTFIKNLIKILPANKVKHTLDIVWIVLGGLFTFGMFIYFVGIKPFEMLFQSLNNTMGKSTPLFWEPLSQMINKLPVNGTQFLMGSAAVLFILIADFICRHLFTHACKKG